MLQNAYLLANIGADTAENEQHFAENSPKIGNYPTGRTAREAALYLQIGSLIDAATARLRETLGPLGSK